MGFDCNGAAQNAASAAGRGQRQGDDGDDAPAGADSPAAAPSATGARGVTRHTSPCSTSPAKRPRGQSIVTVEELDQEPAAAPAAAAAAAAPQARGLQRNHIRLYMHQNNVRAEQFQLRTTGDKDNQELTTTARSNLLIELGGARGDTKEEQRICRHYTVHRTTAKLIQKKWRERAHVRTATRKGRPSIMDSPGHKTGLRELNRESRAAGVAKQSESSRALDSLRGGKIPGTNKRYCHPELELSRAECAGSGVLVGAELAGMPAVRGVQ